MTMKSLALTSKSLTGLMGAAREARGAGWGEYLSAGLITLGILVALMI